MRTVFIIHGAYGSPAENWIPWLQKELGRLNYRVVVPHFPTPGHQTLPCWLEVMQRYERDFRNDSIIVGHSIGSAFILGILEKIKKPVYAVMLVAPFITPLGNHKFDAINKTFYREFDWNKIKLNCKEFHIFHSDNDPYVPRSKAEEIAKKLGVEITTIKGAGHFNTEAGYTTFPLLLQEIEETSGRIQKSKKKI